MKAAMVVTWKRPYPGRELKALEYGLEVMEYWGKQAADGKCTEPELFFSDKGIGLWFVKGERSVLETIGFGERGLELQIKGQLLLEDFSIDLMHSDETAADYMARFGKVATAII